MLRTPYAVMARRSVGRIPLLVLMVITWLMNGLKSPCRASAVSGLGKMQLSGNMAAYVQHHPHGDQHTDNGDKAHDVIVL